MTQFSFWRSRGTAWLVAGACLCVALPADAKRLGGGKAVGKQSNSAQQAPKGANSTPTNSAQSTAAPANNAAAPATAAPAAAKAAAPAAAGAAAQAARKPWSGMLMGLAAGLGIMALASYFGFGDALAQFVTIALLAVFIMVAGAWLLRRFAGRNAGPTLAPAGGPAPLRRESAGLQRPFQQPFAMPQPTASSVAAALPMSAEADAAGLDEAQFVMAAKRNFVALQAAWDQADLAGLRDMMTDELHANIKEQLAERGSAPNRTDVVTLEAEFRGLEVIDGYYLASVEFWGMIREDASTGAHAFREVWNMTKPVNGSRGWLVAGIQPLQ